jgi:hypothetical protein
VERERERERFKKMSDKRQFYSAPGSFILQLKIFENRRRREAL